MNSRWIGQRNGSGCGPVAILNLLKWLGEPIAYAENYPYYSKKMKTSRYGTELRDFVRVLYGINGIKISPRNVPDIGVIEEALDNGKAVIMKSAYFNGKDLEGHYFLVTQKTEKSFFCVNINRKHQWVSKPSFRLKWLQHHQNYCNTCGIAPYCWIVRKM
jgi:hypothetical protein